MNHLKRIPGYSLLRVPACIAIIILHMFASAEILFQNVITPCNNAGADNRKQCNRKLYDVGGSMLCDGDRSAAVR